MYEDIIDITFIPGVFKKINNFTYLNNYKQKRIYLDYNLVLKNLKKNEQYLKEIN